MRGIKALTQYADIGRPWKDWYGNAYQQIKDIQGHYVASTDFIASILAITSPRVQIVRNCKITLYYLKTGELPNGVLGNVRSSLKHFLLTGDILGPKTSAFKECVLGNPNAVVLDTWMAKALRIKPDAFKSRLVREEAAKRVKKAAIEMVMTPAECQAAIWAGMFRSAGRVPSYLPLVQTMEAYL